MKYIIDIETWERKKNYEFFQILKITTLCLREETKKQIDVKQPFI